MPLNRKDWLIVVCTESAYRLDLSGLRCNGTPGRKLCPQLLAPSAACSGKLQSVLVVDRKGGGDNLEEYWLEEVMQLDLAPDSILGK